MKNTVLILMLVVLVGGAGAFWYLKSKNDKNFGASFGNAGKKAGNKTPGGSRTPSSLSRTADEALALMDDARSGNYTQDDDYDKYLSPDLYYYSLNDDLTFEQTTYQTMLAVAKAATVGPTLGTTTVNVGPVQVSVETISYIVPDPETGENDRLVFFARQNAIGG